MQDSNTETSSTLTPADLADSTQDPQTETHTASEESRPVAQDGQEKDYKTKYEEMRQHARTWEERARENQDAAKELKKFKDAQKTEEERLRERNAELEEENTAYKQRDQLRTWSAEVSDETGVPAAVLKGNTREELLEHAQAIKAAFPAPSEEPSAQEASYRPVPRIGETPTATPDVNAQIAAAQEAGDTDLVRQLKASMLGS